MTNNNLLQIYNLLLNLHPCLAKMSINVASKQWYAFAAFG